MTTIVISGIVFAAVAVGLWPAPPARVLAAGRAGGAADGSSRVSRAPHRLPIHLLGLVAAAAVPVAPMLSVLIVVGSVIAYASGRRSAQRRRRAELVDALPDALDLCTVVLGAGGTIRDAVVALAGHGPFAVRPSAARAVRRADAGLRFDQALREFRADLGPVFQPLTGALLLAHEQGGSVGMLLSRLSLEASTGRRRLGELRARRLPVALLAPLIVCSLPAVLIGAVVPLALVALAQIDL